MKITRSSLAKVAAVAGIALAAMGTATMAQARSNVFFSIGANVAPGVTLGVSNGYYAPPVYVQPAPVYYQPAPVYYQPQTVYYQPAPVYVAPPVYGVTYVRPAYRHVWHHGRYYR
jgi:PXPV repeat (3 copies)